MIKPREIKDSENCTLIKRGELKTLSPGIKYLLYEDPDGSIHGETICATFSVAKSREEYEKMSEEKLESIIYGGEMTIAR